MAERLSADDFALLQKNLKAVVYEPRVVASAYAFAAVWDRVRYGTLSQELAAPVLRQQAAILATALAAKPEAYLSCYEQLRINEGRLAGDCVRCLGLGVAFEMDLTILAPDLLLLVCAVVCDGLIGDPVYALHPIRLVGATLSFFERVLRGPAFGWVYVGGCVLFCVLAAFWMGLIWRVGDCVASRPSGDWLAFSRLCLVQPHCTQRLVQTRLGH